VVTNLFKCRTDTAALLLRLGLAAIFIVHGYIKLSVDFQVMPELSRTMQSVVGAIELACGVLMLLGLGSRLAALPLVVLQVVAIVTVSGKYALTGLSAQLGAAQGADYLKVGPEYNLVLITMSLAVIALGSGVVSLDHLVSRWWQRRKGAAKAPAPVPEPVAAHS
jgi:putative oxidoreductase